MSEPAYSKGDWIVHANYGIGQVMGKEKKMLDGEVQQFFRITTSTSEYWLPVEKSEAVHIRPVSSEYQIERALSILRTRAEPLPADHKQRRIKIFKSVSSISLYSKARILRDLYGRKLTGKLNVTEAEILLGLKKQIIDEWSVISGLDKDGLIIRLNQALDTGFGKLKYGDDRSELEKVRKGVEERPTEKTNKRPMR